MKRKRCGIITGYLVIAIVACLHRADGTASRPRAVPRTDHAPRCTELWSAVPPCAIAALRSFYHMRFHTMHRLLDRCQAAYPHDPFPLFVRALIAIRWNDYVTPLPFDEIEGHLHRLRRAVQAYAVHAPSPVALHVARAGMYGVFSLWYAIRERNFAAGRMGKRMFREIRRLRALGFSGCPWMDYLEGTYDYFADTVPKLLQFLGRLLGIPGGNRTRGLALLTRAALRPSPLQPEAVRTLVYIDIFFEHDYRRAMRWSERLVVIYPTNLTHWTFYLRAAIHARDWTTADRIWHEWVRRAIALRYPLPELTWTEAVYWRARWWMHMGNWTAAERVLRYLRHMRAHRPPWLDPWIDFSLAQVYDRTHRIPEAIRIYRRLLRGPDVRAMHRLIRRRFRSGRPLPLDWSNY